MKYDFEMYGGKEVPASPREMLEPKPQMLTATDVRNMGTPLGKQVGGSHYKATKIQPIEVIWDWDLGFELGSALKYIQRHKLKGGTEDIKKAIHYLELYIERKSKAS